MIIACSKHHGVIVSYNYFKGCPLCQVEDKEDEFTDEINRLKDELCNSDEIIRDYTKRIRDLEDDLLETEELYKDLVTTTRGTK